VGLIIKKYCKFYLCAKPKTPFLHKAKINKKYKKQRLIRILNSFATFLTERMRTNDTPYQYFIEKAKHELKKNETN